jgi:hypothetical protein
MWWMAMAAACEAIDLDAATSQVRALWYEHEDLDGALARAREVERAFPCFKPVDDDDLPSFYLLAVELALGAGQEPSAAHWAELAVRFSDAREPRGSVATDVLELWRAARARVEAEGRVTLTFTRGATLDGTPRAAGEEISLLRGVHLGQHIGEAGWVSEALQVDAGLTWPQSSPEPRWTHARTGMVAGGVALLTTGVLLLVFDGHFLQQNARYGDLRAADIGTGLMAGGIVSAAAGAGLLLGGALGPDGAAIGVHGRF